MSHSEAPDSNSPEIVKPKISAVPETAEISAAVRLLLTNNAFEDQDKMLIEAAMAFIENPTKDLKEIQSHSLAIAMVLAPYGDIKNQPPAIVAIHYNLYRIESEHHIHEIETELQQDEPDRTKIEASLQQALNSTGILEKYWHENELKMKVLELQDRMSNL